MRNEKFGELCGFTPPQAVGNHKKKPQPRKNIGGLQRGQVETFFCGERQVRGIVDPEGQGTVSQPRPAQPHKLRVFWARPLLLWIYLGAFPFAAPLHSWQEQETPPRSQGLGGNPAARSVASHPKILPWERGHPSLSLFIVLFLFFFISAFVFPCLDAGSALSGAAAPPWRGPVSPALAGQRDPRAGLAIAASLPLPWSDGRRAAC